MYYPTGLFCRSLVVDFLAPVMDVPYHLITYRQRELARNPLHVFKLVVTGTIFQSANLIILAHQFNQFQASYAAGAALVGFSCMLALIMYFLGRSWNTDAGEVCLLSIGSYVFQGLETSHLSRPSTRVSISMGFMH